MLIFFPKGKKLVSYEKPAYRTEHRCSALTAFPRIMMRWPLGVTAWRSFVSAVPLTKYTVPLLSYVMDPVLEDFFTPLPGRPAALE